MKFLPFLFLVVASVSASYEEGNPQVYGALEDGLLSAINELKEMLRKGIPESGIPPLDPLDLEHQDVNIDLGDLIKLKGGLDKVKGQNLINFNVTQIKVSLLPIGFDFGVSWEPIDLRGHYDVDGVLGKIIPLYGKGPFESKVDGIFFSFKIELTTRGGVLFVKKLDMDFGLKKIKIKIENFLGGALGDAVCELISENLPTMVEQFKIGYLPAVLTAVTEQVNKLLDGKTVQDILDFIESLKPTTTAPSVTPSY